MTKPEKQLHEVTVRVTKDPGGGLGVLLQLPNGWFIMNADGARDVARALTLTAEELEEALNDDDD